MLRGRPLALLYLAVAAPALLLFSFWGTHGLGEILFVLLATTFPVALMALGAANRHGKLGSFTWPFAGLGLLLGLLMLAMLGLRGQVLSAPWFGGFPLATAIQVYGLFLLPLPLVAWLYASTFDRSSLKDEDLQRLRARFQDPQDTDNSRPEKTVPKKTPSNKTLQESSLKNRSPEDGASESDQP